MKRGFYPALGTPLDEQGSVLEASLIGHVEDQIGKRAAGMLVMGSMGIQPAIRNSEYPKVAAIAARAAGGFCPVYVGAMDTSVARVLERIDSLRGLPLDGVVMTAPYYYVCRQEEIASFYRMIADRSPFPVYMYDLPVVTQSKIKLSTAVELAAHPNVGGIKTGDLILARTLGLTLRAVRPDFEIIYSGLETFDVAYGYGIAQNLDGMFSCASGAALDMYAALEAGDRDRAAACLDRIVGLRDVFADVGVFPGFTCAMNLLGFEGRFHADYASRLGPAEADKVKSFMQQHGLL